MLTVLAVLLFAAPLLSGLAETLTEFPGTVLTVDPATGKFAVKKDSGGTRFTFTANERTQFEGGPKNVQDLKPGDHVVVLYGPQYLAVKVSLKK
jgi:hypothetical protein